MNQSEYADGLYAFDDPILKRMPDEAEAEGLPPIHIPDEVGRLLQVLIAASGARRILELGSLFGYSSIWMARALPADGSILTLEYSEKHAEVTRKNLQAVGLADKVEVRVGPALETLPSLEGSIFDLIFIDADKPNYPNYLDFALKLSHPGTLIVGDNTWRHGDVVTESEENGVGMAAFNRKLAAEPRLISTMVPTRDGGDAITVAVVRA
jgi:predicted O-methyltransferase YrrM